MKNKSIAAHTLDPFIEIDIDQEKDIPHHVKLLYKEIDDHQSCSRPYTTTVHNHKQGSMIMSAIHEDSTVITASHHLRMILERDEGTWIKTLKKMENLSR